MPEPALMFWILGVPLLGGIVDLFLTMRAIRQTPPHLRERGIWSQATHVGSPAARPAQR